MNQENKWQKRNLADLARYTQQVRFLQRKKSGDLIGNESFTKLEERQLAFLETEIERMKQNIEDNQQ